ncbi:Pentatricopeptide repeat-containing protein 2, mitochondrial [Schizosaccharomyces pombe]
MQFIKRTFPRRAFVDLLLNRFCLREFVTTYSVSVSNARKLVRKRLLIADALKSKEQVNNLNEFRNKKTKSSLIRNDGFKLANNVSSLLQKESLEKALHLLYERSNAKKTVAYNLILQYHLAKGHYNAAWSLYNDMKKRQQKPSDHTYSILLKGFCDAIEKNKQGNLSKLREYSEKVAASALKESNNVTSNLHHIRIISKCSLKLKSMVLVSMIIPSIKQTLDFYSGSQILRLLNDFSMLNPEQREEVLKMGTNLWNYFVLECQKKGIAVDESLICSFVKLLATSNSPQVRNVGLNILTKVMGLEYQIFEDSNLRYPLPPYCDCTSRSLVTALQVIRQIQNGDLLARYWKYFEESHKFDLNLQVYHEKLRNLVQQGQAAECLNTIERMSHNGPFPTQQTFLIVLSLCKRPKFYSYTKSFLDLAKKLNVPVEAT